MDFFIRLKELTTENNLTVKALSEATKIPRTTINNYMNRGSIPSITQVIVLADFFGCSVDYLIGREDDFGVIQSINPEQRSLTDSERELIDIFRSLSEARQETLLDTMRVMGSKIKRA